MKTLIIDTLTNEFYCVACSSNPKGFLSNPSDEGNPGENDFPYWSEDESEAFDFCSELSAQNEINMNDITEDGTRMPMILNK